MAYSRHGTGTYMMTDFMHTYSPPTPTRYGGTGGGTGESQVRAGAGDGIPHGIMAGIHPIGTEATGAVGTEDGMPATGAVGTGAIGDTLTMRGEDGIVRDILICARDGTTQPEAPSHAVRTHRQATAASRELQQETGEHRP